MTRLQLRLGIAATLAAAIIGCGGDEQTIAGSSEDETPAAGVPGGADPEEVRVIDEWAEALSEGDLEAAADFFKLPSTAQNGTPLLPLRTREDVIAFNGALPCGAELTRAETEGKFTVATFELTERPGAGDCGPGRGGTAKTAFEIEDGLITEWIRAADDTLVEPPSDEPIV